MMESVGSNPDSLESRFDIYMVKMTAHCPFLTRALEEGRVTNTISTCHGSEFVDILESAYRAAYAAASRVAAHRDNKLYCENVLLLLSSPFRNNDEYENAILSVLHEIIREQFLGCGVIVGKFWEGDPSRTKDGSLTPRSPVPFVSIRSAVVDRDERFLDHDPSLLRRFKRFSSFGPVAVPLPIEDVKAEVVRVISDAVNIRRAEGATLGKNVH